MLSSTTHNLLQQLTEVLDQIDTAIFQSYLKYRFKKLCIVSNKFTFTKEQRILYCDLVNRYKSKFVYDTWNYDPEAQTDSLLAHS
jgi:hypothetical protein